MPQLTWRNPNPFDEWWNVWALVAPRLAASGLEVTKSENTTASGMTVGYRRVIKISDGMYAELLNLQGELAKSGLKFWATQFYNSAVGYQNAEIDSYVSNNPTGVYGPCAFIGLHTLGGELSLIHI